ncbi:hypothetical protein EYF80_034890 [Liparis tanakae]|uniref:Uncharacterized protein n=1 Tax=Liparis tanakae TaxID=230148 RepID=A0A4Z2GNR6_9TELE|nr:hypothetical protein EYF80_034890 [Liparis tanakae]
MNLNFIYIVKNCCTNSFTTHRILRGSNSNGGSVSSDLPVMVSASLQSGGAGRTSGWPDSPSPTYCSSSVWWSGSGSGSRRTPGYRGMTTACRSASDQTAMWLREESINRDGEQTVFVYVDHEFFTSQYGSPLSVPYPTASTA